MKTFFVAATSAVVGFTLGVITKAVCDKFDKKKDEKCEKKSPTEEKK